MLVAAVPLLGGCLSDDYYVDMVDVDGGTFIMGSNDADADADESPIHIEMVQSFKIGRYEVTQKLWKRVMHDKNPSLFKGDNRPVENVSWDDIQLFIFRLNRVTGHKYRLPTEVEWEYAAKGGNRSSGYRYSGGELEQTGWFVGNSDNTTHDVGLLNPNELDIFDMTGNVHEWCEDLYDSLAYCKNEECRQPFQTDGKKSAIRVYRGGSWSSSDKYCRISNRNKHTADLRHPCLGFRLAEDSN